MQLCDPICLAWIAGGQIPCIASRPPSLCPFVRFCLCTHALRGLLLSLSSPRSLLYRCSPRSVLYCSSFTCGSGLTSIAAAGTTACTSNTCADAQCCTASLPATAPSLSAQRACLCLMWSSCLPSFGKCAFELELLRFLGHRTRMCSKWGMSGREGRIAVGCLGYPPPPK